MRGQTWAPLARAAACGLLAGVLGGCNFTNSSVGRDTATAPAATSTDTTPDTSPSASAAPAISVQPQAASATVGGQAVFSVSATGAGTLRYQWQRNGADVPGATSAQFTVSGLTAADHGVRLRVVVSNAAGSTTSQEAVLSISSHGWTSAERLGDTGQGIESGRLGIDDQGRAVTVFVQQQGGRLRLMAAHGRPGVTPHWPAPQPIDADGAAVLSYFASPSAAYFDLAVAPGGNAAAFFVDGPGPVAQAYAVRYRADLGVWSAPKPLGPVYISAYDLRTNDRGDVALLINAPTLDPVSGLSRSRSGVIAWSGPGDTVVDTRLPDTSLFLPRLALDGAGRLLVAHEVYRNGGLNNDVAVIWGDVTRGLGSSQVVDTLAAGATLKGVALGGDGAAAVVWQQSNGSRVSVFAATSTGPGGAWQVADTGLTQASSVQVDDAGQAMVYDLVGWQRRQQLGGALGAWQPPQALPLAPKAAGAGCVPTRQANLLCWSSTSGLWWQYDAALQPLHQPAATPTPADRILGVPMAGAFLGGSAVSVGGHAVLAVLGPWSSLPSTAHPIGVADSVSGWWALYLD